MEDCTLATYRLSVTLIGRSAGRSVTAAAAYRAGQAINDNRTGQSHDYTRRQGVVHAAILTPPGTPDWMQERGQLWNAVEAAEKRKDAQLAREVQLSLPHELTPEARRELVTEFARQHFVAKGMIADLAIHAPDRRGDQRNHHAHILLTTRSLTGEGFGKKDRSWNQKDLLEGWREQWAHAVNRALERAGERDRVDHRSYADRGIDREAEPKQGPLATELERRGQESHAGNDRRATQERNAERDALRDQAQEIEQKIIKLAHHK